MKEKKHSSFNDFAEKINNKITDKIFGIFLSIFIIICLLYLIIDTLIAKPNTFEYDYSRFYLFIMICIVYSSSILFPGVVKLMLDAFRKLLKNPKQLTHMEIMLNIYFGGTILASISFLLMDFSFFRNIGLKISTVVIVYLIGIFMSYYKKPKKRRK
ncbi:MAG: hypothetical protein Q8940_18595 [Bacteroidota bacterium]|nr:hypothetical protein [Bacteroidota bacterium]